MASVPVSSCQVFVQIWVDVAGVQNGNLQGIYAVDNRVSEGSQNEGTSGLMTSVAVGYDICWNIFSIDPTLQNDVLISGIGNCIAWGASGQPEAQGSAFTGTAMTATGATGYNVNITVHQPGGSGISATLPLAIAAS